MKISKFKYFYVFLEDKLVSAGIYVFNRAITKYLPEIGSIEKTTFPTLAERRLLKAYRLSKNELNRSPQLNLSQGIDKTMAYFRNHK